jgi:hypothetical protein
MAISSWHAFFYEGVDTSRPPVRSTWIDAEREEDAIRIAKESLKRGQCVELTRPRWEGGHAPILVSGAGAQGEANGGAAM